MEPEVKPLLGLVGKKRVDPADKPFKALAGRVVKDTATSLRPRRERLGEIAVGKHELGNILPVLLPVGPVGLHPLEPLDVCLTVHI